MLVRCKIGNFKSFKEPQEINLFPYGQNSFKENIHYFNDEELYFGASKKENEKRNKNRLLKLALITGKNASGKSNFFEGMEFFKDFFIKAHSSFLFLILPLSEQIIFRITKEGKLSVVA